MENDIDKKSNKELLSEAMRLLYKLEDRTGYQESNLGEAINLLQKYELPKS